MKADSTADNKTQLEMDLKPLQLDFCLKLGLERFPSTRICKPTSKHFGLTLFGVEVLGFNYQADDQTIIEDFSCHPFVVTNGIEIPEHHHREPKTADGIRITSRTELAVSMRALPAYHLIDHSPESPIVLAGPPRRLIGRAQLYNRGDERAVTRQAELRDLPSRRLPAEQAETARQCAVSMVPPRSRPAHRGAPARCHRSPHAARIA